MVLGVEAVRLCHAAQRTIELGFEVLGHGEVAHHATPGAHEVVVVALGERLVELVPRVLVGGDDAMHHTGVFEDHQVAVGGGHRETTVARDDLGDRERRVRLGEHLDQRLAAARVALVGASEPFRREMMRIGGGHQAIVAKLRTSENRTKERAMQHPKELFDLTGKVALVTGGSRGIGRALVEGFAAAGADVVIASRKLDNCVDVANAIERDTARRALPVECNVSHWDQCDRLVDTMYEEFGRCDVLVNNAGLSPLYENLPSVTEALYDKTHAVNAKGPFRLASLIGTRMYEAGGGSIINVSSTGSWRPGPQELPYAMAKAALNALTLGLAGAWNPTVRANTVLPGPYDTDVAAAWAPELLEQVSRANPMRRMGQPADMVGVCLFLASDAGAYVNGAQILMDGGMVRTL